MPKQRNKAHHLQAIASAAASLEKSYKVQTTAVVQARTAGATWAEIAAMMPRNIGAPTRSKQHAAQLFAGYRYDPTTDELVEEPPLF